MGDFKQTTNMLRPFYRGLPIVIGMMVIAVSIAKKYLHYATPMYESVSKIKLADATVGIPHSNLYRNLDIFASSSKIGAEVEMLKSEVVIGKALDHLDLDISVSRIGDLHKTELYHDCPIIIIGKPSGAEAFDVVYSLVITGSKNISVTAHDKKMYKGTIGNPIVLPSFIFTIAVNDSLLSARPSLPLNDRFEFIVHSRVKLVDEIREKIDVMALDKEVPVLRVAYKTPVAQKSADIVNAVSEAYIRDYVDEKFVAADTALNFLNKEVDKYSKKLESTETDIQNFRESNKVLNIKQETETSLRQISELKNHLAGLRMDLVAIDSLDQYVKNGRENFKDLAPNFQTFNDLLSTEIIKKIKSLQSDKRDLLLKYTPESEKVKVVEDKLGDLYSYLGESVNNTRTNLQVKYNDLEKTIKISEAEFATFPYKDRNMTILERNFNLNDQNYRFLREKKTEAEIAKAASISFHRIIVGAEVATIPVSPNPSLLKTVAGFLGFLIGTSLIYLVHFLKGKVNDVVNIQKNSDTPIFTSIPFLKTHEQLTVAFDKLAIDLYVKKALENGAIVTISSFGKMEGKRTIAQGLAASAGQLGKRVVLIDADNTVQCDPAASYETITLDSLNADWKHPEVLQTSLRELLANNDIIIVKNFPVGVSSASMLLMGPASINLMVLDSRRTPLKRIEDTDVLKSQSGLTNIHFILNRDSYTPSLFLQVASFVRSISRKAIQLFKKTAR